MHGEVRFLATFDVFARSVGAAYSGSWLTRLLAP